MISFQVFKRLATKDKVQSVCESVNVSYEGNIKPLIDHTVNANDSTEFSKAFKRLKEHAASVKYVHGN